ncbi:dihydroxyacetone kinase subunit L [Photobacterium sp. GJ3]|uniref:dihydroxyacetone kinase subunit DhaL n=1 Tax=Photobacterium sp. GJ3 TaxID=2829502 RepID=UPI001B8CCAD6|nr:dihydroxyacetone kinase subunit DhaL [Photobacterium sp. GJ3]QUJ67843.1 dihydroxyacetone kinase subunit L [Photobacterium sp. GJ3]
MTVFNNQDGRDVMLALCDTIIQHKTYLSEVDGLIGDGDHGINMAKGFNILKTDLDSFPEISLDKGFSLLSNILMGSIGGSMGPLYGSLFFGMAAEIEGKQQLTSTDFSAMLLSGLDSLRDITDAGVGDKCLMDALVPAVHTFEEKQQRGCRFEACLIAMATAAQTGRDSTKNLVAKIGRASRLGERSIGVLDAGSVSCALLLTSLAKSVQDKLTTPID